MCVCVWCVCGCGVVCVWCVCVCVWARAQKLERVIHSTPSYISLTLHSHLFLCLLTLLFSSGTSKQNFTCMSYFHSSTVLTYESSSKNDSSHAYSRSYCIPLSHFEKKCNFSVRYSVSGRNFGERRRLKVTVKCDIHSRSRHFYVLLTYILI